MLITYGARGGFLGPLIRFRRRKLSVSLSSMTSPTKGKSSQRIRPGLPRLDFIPNDRIFPSIRKENWSLKARTTILSIPFKIITRKKNSSKNKIAKRTSDIR